MAIDIIAGIATQLNLTNQRLVSQIRQAVPSSDTRATTPSRNLPSSLGLSLDPRQNVTLRTGIAQRAVNNAISSGNQIIDDLRQLEARLSTAINQGLVSNRTELLIAGNRQSRLNIGVSANRAQTAIDRLVARAETGGVNLISSDQNRVSIQTTEFGGKISVLAQPLDSRGLDIRNLSVLTSTAATEARARVRIAIATASSRLESLTGLQRSLDFRIGTPQIIADFGDGGVFDDTVRGRLVNLSA